MKNAVSGFLAFLAVFLVVCSGTASTAEAGPLPNAVAYQINKAHTGFISMSSFGPQLRVRWTANLGSGISYPVIAGGKVFVTVKSASGYGTNLYALDSGSGSVAWGPSALGGTYYWSGCCYESGRVFALNYSGLLRAFDANTGQIIWSRQLPGQYAFSSAPTAYNGVVYAGGAGSGGTVYAVSSATGAVLWTAPVANGDQSSPAVSDDGVYVSYACAMSYKFNPQNGTRIWNFNTGCSGGGGKNPVLHGGNLYVRDYQASYILDAATGTSKGTFTSKTAPAFSGSVGIFSSYPGPIKAYDINTNTLLWSFTGDGGLCSAPVIINGDAYVGSSGGNLYAVNIGTGALDWSTNVGVAIPAVDEQNVSQPLTGLGAGEGLLVVPAGSKLVAYETPAVRSSINYPVNGGAVRGPTCTITGSAWPDAGCNLTQVEVSTDGGATWNLATGATSWTYSWAVPALGSHTIMSRASESCGYFENPGPGVTVMVDNIPPVSSITSPANGATLGGNTCTVTGTANDGAGAGVSKVEVSINGGAWTTASGTTNWSLDCALPAEGSCTISSRATDNVGNVETPGPAITATVSNTPHTLTVSWSPLDKGIVTVEPPTGPYLHGTKVTLTASPASGYVFSGWSGDISGTASPVTITMDSDKSITAGFGTRGAGGDLSAWGENVNGQLGDGTTVEKDAPTGVSGMTGVASMSVNSGRHAVALKSDGTVWTWGYNYYGQLGDGTTTQRTLPAQVSGLSGASAVSTGNFYSLALKSDGTVWAWGYNCYGQLGDGTTTNRPAPVQVKNLGGVVAVAAGYEHALALKSDGTVWAWGLNNYGQLGDGTTAQKTTPVQVTGLSGVTAIAGDLYSSLALKSDGSVWAWGCNSYGLLGKGAPDYSAHSTPVQISSLSNVAGICIGSYSYFAVKSDGTAWSWGDNWYGKLGDGTTTQRNAPGQVSGLSGVSAIACGSAHTLALKNDGTVWAWGLNTQGELGFGARDGNSHYTQAKINSLGNVRGISAGGMASMAISGEVDLAPPYSSVVTPSDGAVIGGSACAITGAASDDADGSGVAEVDVSINGGAWVAASGTTAWSLSWNPPYEGVYVIRSRAVDNYGNVETPGAGASVTFVRTPTTTAISSSPNPSLYSQPVTLTAAVTPPEATGTVSFMEGEALLGAGSLAAGKAVFTTTALTTGTHADVTAVYDGDRAYLGSASAALTQTVNRITPHGSSEVPHYKWDGSMIPDGTDCTFCHAASRKFLAPDFMDSTVFCTSCHNVTGSGHALSLYSSRGQHAMFANATAAGRRKPRYGNITAGEVANSPASRLKDGYKVTCVTCHNAMKKPDDPGRTWEMTTNPSGDGRKYYLQNGGWNASGNLALKVYSDTSLWVSGGPAYTKAKETYLVKPSEYIFNEISGFVRFKKQQDPASYIYVTIVYPYLRAPMQDNALCSDCHTQATHKDINCLNCHQAHNTPNLKGIREKVRTSNFTTVPVRFLEYTGAYSFAGGAAHNGICEVCHTTTRYYRRDGTGFASHSGGVSYDGKDCTSCHSHYTGFAR